MLVTSAGRPSASIFSSSMRNAVIALAFDTVGPNSTVMQKIRHRRRFVLLANLVARDRRVRWLVLDAIANAVGDNLYGFIIVPSASLILSCMSCCSALAPARKIDGQHC